MPEKSLILRRFDCLENICKAINEAELPAFVTAELLERVLAEVQNNANMEYQRDLSAYKKRLEEEVTP